MTTVASPLEQALAAMGSDLTSSQEAALVAYLELMAKWNKTYQPDRHS